MRRTPRCPHGFSRDPVVRCWVCDEPNRDRAASIRSETSHGVHDRNRGPGRAREHRASGYVVGRARRAGS